jgi:phosphatidylserine decarboxylase
MNEKSYYFNLFYIKELFSFLIIANIIGINCNKYLFYISLFLTFNLLFFYRNNFEHKLENDYFISPSSSRNLKIIENNDNYVVINHISLFDRHFMIAPVDCEILNILNLNIDDNDAERKRVIFKDKYNNIFSIDQIVNKFYSHLWIYGFLPSFLYKERCIVHKKIGDKLKQGDRYGLIRFGSMIQYNLPKFYKLNLKKNKYNNLGDKIAKINK